MKKYAELFVQCLKIKPGVKPAAVNMRIPALKDILAYKNEIVVHDFVYKNNIITALTPEQLFTDLLAWLWLNAYRKMQSKTSLLFGPLLPLDAIWHTFILHTRDYHDFCNTYFGEYFHHHVEPVGFEQEITGDDLADFLEDCFTYLGEAWVERYFEAISEP